MRKRAPGVWFPAFMGRFEHSRAASGMRDGSYAAARTATLRWKRNKPLTPKR
jgi:hypothetical protein